MNRASSLSIKTRGIRENNMSETNMRIVALVPPPIFWQALLVMTQESIAFRDEDFRVHSTSVLWGISVEDSVNIVERYLNEAIRGGMLSLGQTVA